MDYQHLRLRREADITERHRKQDKRPRFAPPDPRRFGRELASRFERAKRRLEEDLPGYDDRRLIKIRIRAGETLPGFARIPGIELVSQEQKSIVLAFVTDKGVAEFESRLATLAREGSVTRKELLYAIEDFDHWTPDERTGNALREQGFPDETTFVLDVELWPQERPDRRRAMLERFKAWLAQAGMVHLDSLLQPSLVMVRRCP